MGKDTTFVFDENYFKTFETIKEKLVTTPIMIMLDWGQPFEFMCDVSDYTVGEVLGQWCENIFRSIHYASKTLTELN